MLCELKECPVCGIKFESTGEWVYKTTHPGHAYFCTWGCFRKWQRDPQKYVIKKRYSEPTMYTIDGVTKPLNEWADEFGINRQTARSRLKRGKDPFKKSRGSQKRS